jgi:hypothetical protein
MGDEHGQMYYLAGLACVAARRGDTRTAGRLWAVAGAIGDRVGAEMHASERQRYERILNPLKDDPCFQEGQTAGRALPLDQAIPAIARGLAQRAPLGE